MENKLKVFFSILCISFSCIVFSQQTANKATVNFAIKNFSFNVNGTFKTTEVIADFSDTDFTNWHLKGSTKVKSIDTGINKRDAHLLETDYFDANTYPEITLEATNFEKTSENTYNVTVNLTIKDITKQLVIPITINNNGDTYNIQSNFEINRLDFKVGSKSIPLSNTVKISVNTTVKKD